MDKQLIKQAFILGYRRGVDMLTKQALIPGPATQAAQKPNTPPVWTTPEFQDRWRRSYSAANQQQRQTMLSKLEANRAKYSATPDQAAQYDAFAKNLSSWAKMPNGPGIGGSSQFKWVGPASGVAPRQKNNPLVNDMNPHGIGTAPLSRPPAPIPPYNRTRTYTRTPVSSAYTRTYTRTPVSSAYTRKYTRTPPVATPRPVRDPVAEQVAAMLAGGYGGRPYR